MSKRNFILLIIIIVIAIIAGFGYFYFNQETNTPGEDSTGTNFISQFNPFGNNNNTTKPTTETSPVDVSGYEPSTEIDNLKLRKVSSMPIAGFTVFSKERLKEVPVVTSATPPTTPYDFGTTTLKSGNTGEVVKEIQRFLNNTLNLSLELDGVLDEEISVAIKKWQGDHGLVADGIVGAKTKMLMYSSVNQVMETTKPTPPPTEFMPALRYVERATGNIYQTFADKIEEKKFSTTIIPMIYEAYFGNKGQSVIMRYLKGSKTIITFVGTLPKEFLGGDTKDSNEIKGVFLPEDIKDISLSTDANSIFYLFSSGSNLGDNIIGITMNLLTNKKVQVFDSSFTEWLSTFPNNKMITFTTKPSSTIPGYMYAMDPNNKNYNFHKILGNINGLTTITSPNGKLILYSNNNLSLNIYHVDTKVSNILGVKTLAEKCVWNKTSDAVYCGVPKSISPAQYPDNWYQGEVSFGDQIWKIDVKTGNTTIVIDPTTVSGGEDIDSIKPALDDGENYLFFVNKKDSFLWELGLK